MVAYDRCINLAKKNLADSVAIHGRDRELFRPPTYCGYRTEPTAGKRLYNLN